MLREQPARPARVRRGKQTVGKEAAGAAARDSVLLQALRAWRRGVAASTAYRRSWCFTTARSRPSPRCSRERSKRCAACPGWERRNSSATGRPCWKSCGRIPSHRPRRQGDRETGSRRLRGELRKKGEAARNDNRQVQNGQPDAKTLAARRRGPNRTVGTDNPEISELNFAAAPAANLGWASSALDRLEARTGIQFSGIDRELSADGDRMVKHHPSNTSYAWHLENLFAASSSFHSSAISDRLPRKRRTGPRRFLSNIRNVVSILVRVGRAIHGRIEFSD